MVSEACSASSFSSSTPLELSLFQPHWPLSAIVFCLEWSFFPSMPNKYLFVFKIYVYGFFFHAGLFWCKRAVAVFVTIVNPLPGTQQVLSVFVKRMYTCMLEKASYICSVIHNIKEILELRLYQSQSLQKIHEILKWNTWEMFYLGTIYTSVNGFKGK